MATNGNRERAFSSTQEARKILDALKSRFAQDATSLPEAAVRKLGDVTFSSNSDQPYFPIPFKETETAAALKAIEGAIASSLFDLANPPGHGRTIAIDLEKTTAFLFQTYLATVGGYGKLNPEAKKFLKGALNPRLSQASQLTVRQIWTCFRRNLTNIDACQRICTRRADLGSTITSMAHWRRRLP